MTVVTTSPLQTSIDEIYEYLSDPKVEVRRLAVELLAGLSVDSPEALAVVSSNLPKYVSMLFSRLSDQPTVAAIAWDALINLASDSKVSCHLFDHHLESILSCIASKTLIFAEAATKLLANMTKHAESRPESARLLSELFPIYLAGSRHNRHTEYEFLASVLADLTNLRAGRLYFVEELSRMEAILQDLHSPSVIRRGGAASIIKNCLFETDFHASIMAKELDDDFVITTLAGRLLDSRSELSEEERERLPVELQLLENLQAEPDTVIRSIIVECLIILATTKKGRDTIRAKEIYPILREWHNLEPVSAMKLLIEKMVELLIRDEEQ